MTALGLLPFDRASVNCSENQLPNLMLLLQPAHVQPFWVGPLGNRSQSQLWVFPALHEAVTAWATPAAVMAYRKADSRLAKKKIRRYLHGYEKDNHFMYNCIYFGQILTVKKVLRSGLNKNDNTNSHNDRNSYRVSSRKIFN